VKSIITLLDNTKNNNFLDNVYIQGYSESTRLMFPNNGLIKHSNSLKSNDVVFFYNYGMIPLNNNEYSIDDDNIFMVNGELTKNGVICIKKRLQQGVMRVQEWFVVEKSNCEVPVGSIVVCRPGTSYKFNEDSVRKCFLTNTNILFYIDESGIKVTNEKVLLDPVEPKPFEKQLKNCGHINNTIYYFKKNLGRVNNKYIFNKKDCYAHIDIIS
jgi:hypothetical protein